MHILLSTDKNYIMPSAVMMKSVSVNNAEEEVIFHILIDHGVSVFQQEKLKRVISNPRHSVIFHLVEDKYFDGFPMGNIKAYITKATYYRLIVTDILPDDVHKIIYLDGDIIVKESLRDLWNIDINNYAVGAVTDLAENRHDYHRLGYPKAEGYFNAGVLLINVDYWRENSLKDVYYQLISKEPDRIILHDQDVLNITLYDKKLILPIKYNLQNGFLMKPEYTELGDRYREYEQDLLSAIKNPTIIHFTSTIKPWHIEDTNPYSYEFIKYYKQTEWRSFPLTECGSQHIIRHWGGKILRFLHIVSKRNTEWKKFYSIEEINKIK